MFNDIKFVCWDCGDWFEDIPEHRKECQAYAARLRQAQEDAKAAGQTPPKFLENSRQSVEGMQSESKPAPEPRTDQSETEVEPLCEWCSGAMDAQRKTRRYCSDKCRMAAKRAEA